MPNLPGPKYLQDVIAALDAGRMETADVERSIQEAIASGLVTRIEAIHGLRKAARRNESAGIISRLQPEGVGPWERITPMPSGRGSVVAPTGLNGATTSADRETRVVAERLESAPASRRPVFKGAGSERRSVDEDPQVARIDASRFIGQILSGRYRLERESGRGGMGMLFHATDLESESGLVGVTMLRPEFRSFSESLSLLRVEVRVTRMLRHPHIARVYSLNSDRPGVYLVTEYLEGRSLDDHLKELGRGLTVPELRPLVRELCAALAYAHDLEVVHGDLQPANVFLTASGGAKLLYFGFARAAATRNGRLDLRRVSPLTVAYASPEIWDHREPDSRDDVYSLACVIYTALAGAHPFFAVRSSVEAQQLGLVPTPLSMLSEDQNVALARALAFDRTQRTPTVAALLESLGWGRDPPTIAPPTALFPRVTAVSTPVTAAVASPVTAVAPVMTPAAGEVAVTAPPISPVAPHPESVLFDRAPAGLPSDKPRPRARKRKKVSRTRRLLVSVLALVLLVAVSIAIAFAYRDYVTPAVRPRPAAIGEPRVPAPPRAVPASPPAAVAAAPAANLPAITPPMTAEPPSVIEKKVVETKVVPAGLTETSIPVLRPLPQAAAAMADSENCPYPKEAVAQGLTGTVFMAVYVTTDGRPGKTRLDKSSGSAVLDQAAVRCVEQFGRFPASPTAPDANGYWGRVRFKWSFGT
jgi:TonB family protein